MPTRVLDLLGLAVGEFMSGLTYSRWLVAEFSWEKAGCGLAFLKSEKHSPSQTERGGHRTEGNPSDMK